jgi:hypothetical protein
VVLSKDCTHYAPRPGFQLSYKVWCTLQSAALPEFSIHFNQLNYQNVGVRSNKRSYHAEYWTIKQRLFCFFIEMLVPNQESNRWYVLGASIFSVLMPTTTLMFLDRAIPKVDANWNKVLPNPPMKVGHRKWVVLLELIWPCPGVGIEVGETCDHLDTEVKCNTVLSDESIDLVIPEEVTEDICITALLCVLISIVGDNVVIPVDFTESVRLNSEMSSLM